MLQLSELILLNGMQTNSNNPGTERLTVSALRPDFGFKPDIPLSVDDMGTGVKHCDGCVEPHGVFLVKGWTRCYAMNVVLLFLFETPDKLKAPSIKSDLR